tara:strand:+ start:1036 stop:1137 length:102 start_codon:yes stop_codon:yes gene_type:complete
MYQKSAEKEEIKQREITPVRAISGWNHEQKNGE